MSLLYRLFILFLLIFAYSYHRRQEKTAALNYLEQEHNRMVQDRLSQPDNPFRQAPVPLDNPFRQVSCPGNPWKRE